MSSRPACQGYIEKAYFNPSPSEKKKEKKKALETERETLCTIITIVMSPENKPILPEPEETASTEQETQASQMRGPRRTRKQLHIVTGSNTNKSKIKAQGTFCNWQMTEMKGLI